MVASATAGYITAHLGPATLVRGHPSLALVQQATVHGYTVGFWWAAGIFAAGAVICGALLRSGPLTRQPEIRASQQPASVRAATSR